MKDCKHSSVTYEFDGEFLTKYCLSCGEELDEINLNEIISNDKLCDKLFKYLKKNYENK